MDANDLLKGLMSESTVKALSKETGISADQISSVLSSALPSLAQGATKQATDSSTAAGFAKALASHASEDTSDLSKFFGGVDLADGAKILGHLLGNESATTTKTAAKKAGVSEDNASTILASAAPLLMSLLGQGTTQAQTTSKSSAKTTAKTTSKTASKTTSKTASKDEGIDAADVLKLLTKLMK